MKKFLTLFLVVVMVLSIAIPAFAEDAVETATPIENASGNTQMDVTVSTEKTAETTKYRVDVSWTSLDFTYVFANSGTWNPAEHEYENRGNGYWKDDKTTSAITVKNHSNIGVSVTATIASATEINGVTATLSDENTPKSLVSAEGKTFAEAPSVQFIVTVSGAPASETIISNQKIAKVTVTLN